LVDSVLVKEKHFLSAIRNSEVSLKFVVIATSEQRFLGLSSVRLDQAVIAVSDFVYGSCLKYEVLDRSFDASFFSFSNANTCVVRRVVVVVVVGGGGGGCVIVGGHLNKQN